MSKVRLEPLTLTHFETIELRQLEKKQLDTEEMLQRMRALVRIGTGAAVFYEDIILGIIGFLEIHTGVYETWLIPSIHLPRYGIIFAKRIKNLLISIEATHPVHRIQTASPADALHDRWMEFLGFQCETPNRMRQYSSDRKDYNLWARLKNGQSPST